MSDEERELSYPEQNERAEAEAREEQEEQRDNQKDAVSDNRTQQEQAARIASVMETLRQLHGGMEQEKKDRERAEQNARQGDYFCLAPVR